jgi:prefoldin subunit 5
LNEAALKARIETLTAQAKQMEQTLQAISGAIQDCQYWLDQLDQTNAANKVDNAQDNGEG